MSSRLDLGSLDLEAIEDRLYSLRAAARKHHCAVDDLPRKLGEFEGQISLVQSHEDIIAALEGKVAKAKEDYRRTARKLHESRLSAAEELDQIINRELTPLKLDKAVFKSSVEESPSESGWGPYGIDEVRFLVATNTSSESEAIFGPLNKIASGGEMARFMLALKVVLADSLPYSGIFVFDEIDTGIGGATASAVGERLSKLSGRHQVLVVTHSPQVAARADHHWEVSKSSGVTTIVPLDGNRRQEEIARMLSGAQVTGEARAAAAKLMKTG